MVNFDTGLSREFRMRERYQIQFRADAFNLCNTPHFSNPNGNVNNSAFATITSVQGGMGREGIDERMFRLGLRVRF